MAVSRAWHPSASRNPCGSSAATCGVTRARAGPFARSRSAALVELVPLASEVDEGAREEMVEKLVGGVAAVKEASWPAGVEALLRLGGRSVNWAAERQRREGTTSTRG